MGVFPIWWWQSGLNILSGAVLPPSTARFYSTVDLQLNDDFHEDRIPEGATPQISQFVPEFFAGVELPQASQFVLSNLDNAITTLKAAGGFKRGKKVIISKGFGSISQGLVTMNPAESYVEYRGVIDSASIGDQAIFSMLPADIDIFDKDFPFEKVTTDKWPNAVDLDDDIPWIVGTAKQVPLALVLADESPEQYQYLVGRGNLTIVAFYRDRLALTEYSGTAVGTTTSTVQLAAGDQEADDFYNKKFIEMDGVVREITDYVGSTNIATVTPTGAWSAGAYTIREWKKITQVIDTVTYTLIEFARRQRDSSETMYKRDRMSADVTGLTTERNPSRYIETLLGLFPDVALNAAGFTTAADAIDTEGDLFVDGALVTRKRIFDILTQVCHIGRLRLRLNDSGELYPVMDGTEDTTRGLFNHDDNIISIGTPEQLPLSQLWKTLELRYRLLFDEDDFRLTTAKHDVNSSEGRIDQSLDYDLIFDKTTADKLCDYLAKRKNSFDESLTITLNHEARGLELGQLINLSLNIPLKSGTYQIINKSLLVQGYEFTVILYDATVFTHTALAEPSDPVTDAQKDFRFTPPAAVTSLAVVHTATIINVSAKAALSWTNPTTNFKEVLVEYKKSADSIYNTFTFTSGQQVEIPGLIPGVDYDFKVTSINNFNLSGGVATILDSTAAGDTADPNPPTSLAFNSVRLGSLVWRFNYSTSTDVKEYEYEIDDNANMASPTFTGRTKDRLINYPLGQAGDLTTIATLYCRVRAIDFSDNESTWEPTGDGVAATTDAILQDDVVNNEITNKSSANVSSKTLSPSGTTLISTSITKRTGTKIRIEFSMVIDAASVGASIINVNLKRGSTIIQSIWIHAVMPSGNDFYMVSGVFDDNISSSGSKTYTCESSSVTVSLVGRNLNLRLLELRR